MRRRGFASRSTLQLRIKLDINAEVPVRDFMISLGGKTSTNNSSQIEASRGTYSTLIAEAAFSSVLISSYLRPARSPRSLLSTTPAAGAPSALTCLTPAYVSDSFIPSSLSFNPLNSHQNTRPAIAGATANPVYIHNKSGS